MKKTCAQVAKEFVGFLRTYGDNIDAQEWAVDFKACSDFPKDPEKVEFDIVCGDTVGVIEIKDPGNKIKNQLKGKKWKVTATEVME